VISGTSGRRSSTLGWSKKHELQGSEQHTDGCICSTVTSGQGGATAEPLASIQQNRNLQQEVTEDRKVSMGSILLRNMVKSKKYMRF